MLTNKTLSFRNVTPAHTWLPKSTATHANHCLNPPKHANTWHPRLKDSGCAFTIHTFSKPLCLWHNSDPGFHQSHFQCFFSAVSWKQIKITKPQVDGNIFSGLLHLFSLISQHYVAENTPVICYCLQFHD